MKSLDEIHDMIATAEVGDGDKVLDICQALLEHVRKVSRRVEILDVSKVDAPRRTSRFANGLDLERYRARFILAECISGHVIRTASAMDIDAFEKALCPIAANSNRCGATLTIYRRQTSPAN